jgi:hypothetical protein
MKSPLKKVRCRQTPDKKNENMFDLIKQYQQG